MWLSSKKKWLISYSIDWLFGLLSQIAGGGATTSLPIFSYFFSFSFSSSFSFFLFFATSCWWQVPAFPIPIFCYLLAFFFQFCFCLFCCHKLPMVGRWVRRSSWQLLQLSFSAYHPTFKTFQQTTSWALQKLCILNYDFKILNYYFR